VRRTEHADELRYNKEVMCITVCMQDRDGTMDDLASERTGPEDRGVQQNKTKQK